MRVLGLLLGTSVAFLCGCGGNPPWADGPTELELRPEFSRSVGVSLRHSFSVHQQQCGDGHCDTRRAPEVEAEVTDTAVAQILDRDVVRPDSDFIPFTLSGILPGTSEVIVRAPVLPAITRSFTVSAVARSELSIGLPNARAWVTDEITEDPAAPGDEPDILVSSTLLMLQRHFDEAGNQLFGAADWAVLGPLGTWIEQVQKTYVPDAQYSYFDEVLFTARGVVSTGTSTGAATLTTSVGSTFSFNVVDLDAVETVRWVDGLGAPLLAEIIFDANFGISVNVVPEGVGGSLLLGEGPPIEVTRIAESPADGTSGMVVRVAPNYRAVELSAERVGTVTLHFEWAGFQYEIDCVVLSGAIPAPTSGG